MSRNRLLLLLAPLLLIGCDAADDDDGPRSATAVIVGNSGNFADQTGSFTVYDPADGAAQQVSASVAFINSLALHDGLLYVIDNTADNAGRITIFEAERLAAAGQIQNPHPPRKMAFVSDAIAYVTNLGDFDDDFEPMPGSVSVVDLAASTVTKQIEAGLVPDGIAVTAGKAFVANAGSGGRGTTLTVIDTATEEAAGTLDVGCDSPVDVFVDGEGELVVVCRGRASFTGDPTNGAVVIVDPATETIVRRQSLPSGLGSANGTQNAYYDEATETLFVLSTDTEDIYVIDTRTNALTREIAVPPDAGLVGLTAVAYDAGRERLYVARLPVGDTPGIPDFTAAGTVVVLDAEGQEIDRFTSGIAPAFIVVR